MKATNIQGPFDLVDYDDKVKVQCMVPETWYTKFFKQIFPRKGAQDRIVANLLEIFFERCKTQGLPEDYNSINEKIAQKVLNEFKQINRQ
jgi:hypothetical protein